MYSLSSAVEISAIEDRSGRCLIYDKDRSRQFVVGPRELRALHLLLPNGNDSLPAVEGGGQVDALTSGQLEKFLRNLMQANLVVDAAAAKKSDGRWSWRARLFTTGTLQVWDPGRHFRKVSGRFSSPCRRYVSLLIPVLAILGIVAGITTATADSARLASAVLHQNLLLTIPMLGVSLALHEYGHGFALALGGRQSRSMGFTWFYLLPVPYCDTAAAWTLESRYSRLLVALGGPTVNFIIAGCAGVAASIFGNSEVLVLTSVINLALGMWNLIPFVKFDGYWAVAFLCNRPALREEGIALMRRSTLLAGTSTPDPSSRRGGVLLPLFGFMSLLFSLLFVVLGVRFYLSLLEASPTAVRPLMVAVFAVVGVSFGRDQLRSLLPSRTRLDVVADGVRDQN